MIEPVPLIQGISNSDAERYYRGTLVLLNTGGKLVPYIFMGKDGNTAAVQVNRDKMLNVRYSDLRRCNIEPFYDQRGNFVGMNVHRSTRRGMEVSVSLFPDILQMINTGDVQAVGDRLNKDFYIRRDEYLPVLEYQTRAVGFLRQDVWYVQDAAIKDRLLKLGVQDESVSVLAQ